MDAAELYIEAANAFRMQKMSTSIVARFLCAPNDGNLYKY